MNSEMVVAYTRDLLEKIMGNRPEPDSDGDLPVEYGGASFFVRIVGKEDPVVQIFSIVLKDVDESVELLSELNTINMSLAFARTFHVANQILIESEIWGIDLNLANFEHACMNVARASDEHGDALHAKFGGTAHFGVNKRPDYKFGFA